MQYLQCKYLTAETSILMADTFLQTALLIGEKCSVLAAEDLGYSGAALDMKIPTYHAPGEAVSLSRL
jgi:hypothetical protein